MSTCFEMIPDYTSEVCLSLFYFFSLEISMPPVWIGESYNPEETDCSFWKFLVSSGLSISPVESTLVSRYFCLVLAVMKF